MTVSSTATGLRGLSRSASVPIGGRRFDRLMAALALLLSGGSYLDGWAHSHGRVDNTFFTPWHGVLYGALFLNGVVLGVVLLINMSRGRSWRTALPQGYLLSLLGCPLFLIAGVGDLAWHTLFGFEVGIDPLLSPTHLLLGLSAFLVMTGPIRSAWVRNEGHEEGTWATVLAPLLALIAMFSLFTFFTTYTHPLNITGTITAPKYQESNGAWGAAGLILQGILLIGTILFAMRRWRLPVGSFVLLFTLNAALMSVWRDKYVLILPALLAGVIADILYALWQPSVKRSGALHLFALIVPFVSTLATLLTIILFWGTSWSIHLWLGVCVVTGVAGLLLSYVVAPPALPAALEQEE